MRLFYLLSILVPLCVTLLASASGDASLLRSDLELPEVVPTALANIPQQEKAIVSELVKVSTPLSIAMPTRERPNKS